MTLEEFLDRAQEKTGSTPRRAGSGYSMRCPAHDDQNPSLSVWMSEENWIKVKCHVGCAEEAILESLGLKNRDLNTRARDFGEPTDIYSYPDEGGRELFQTLRFGHGSGKTFKQRHYDPNHEDADRNGWVWNLQDVRRVPYRLPELIEGVASGSTIYVVEGEKDVETLRALNKVATTCPMGAGKWREEFNEFFIGAQVVIIADRNEAGRAHAETIKRNLQGFAEHIWVYQAKTGLDVTDHLDAGHALEDLVPVRLRARRGLISAREMSQLGMEALEARPEDVPGYRMIPGEDVKFRLGRVYAIGAYTGEGKTSWALQQLRDLSEHGVSVGYHSLEMPVQDLRNKLVAHRGVPLWLTEEPWRLKGDPEKLATYQQAMREMGDWNTDIIFDSNTNARKILDITKDREHQVVIVDHVHRFTHGDRQKLTLEIQNLTNMALELNVMLVILCQLRKFSRGRDEVSYPKPTLQDFRETSSIGDDAAMALSIWRERDSAGLSYTGRTQIMVLKNRYTTGHKDQVGSVFFPPFDPSREMFVVAQRGEE